MDNEIRNEFKDIRQQLTQLTDFVNKLIESSDQMVTHIDFIESTYLNTNQFWLISKKV